MAYELIIGDKAYSSWSLRPWLMLTMLDIPFTERAVRLRQPDTAMAIAPLSPSGLVPALKLDGGTVVSDSLAIIEYLADHEGRGRVWPADPTARAVARSAAAEMHSGFRTLRIDCPMDFLAIHPTPEMTPQLTRDCRRIIALWGALKQQYGAGGPFLFGGFSAVDAMFAPVVTRFRSYQIPLAALGDDGLAAAYGETVWALPAMQAWGRGAAEELASRAAG